MAWNIRAGISDAWRKYRLLATMEPALKNQNRFDGSVKQVEVWAGCYLWLL